MGLHQEAGRPPMYTRLIYLDKQLLVDILALHTPRPPIAVMGTQRWDGQLLRLGERGRFILKAMYSKVSQCLMAHRRRPIAPIIRDRARRHQILVCLRKLENWITKDGSVNSASVPGSSYSRKVP